MPDVPLLHPGLVRLGWDAARSREWSALARSRPRAEPGRVTRDDRTAFGISLDGREAVLGLSGGMHSRGERPTTGDFVMVEESEICGLMERRTAIRRASAAEDDSAQVLAANVDSVLVTSALSNAFRPRRLERLLVVAWQSGATPVVVLTKSDSCDDVGAAVAEARALSPGVVVHAVSSVTGDGLGELAAGLPAGSTTVAIGPSGSGKSTLANRLSLNGDLATTPVRPDGKGRHTTSHRQLVELANGALLIDTPGLRSIGLFAAEEAIGEAFSDVAELAGSCRFNDCEHRTEPGCAVLAAVEAGTLEAARLESYRRLLRDQQRLEARLDARQQAERGRELRTRSKEIRRAFKR